MTPLSGSIGFLGEGGASKPGGSCTRLYDAVPSVLSGHLFGEQYGPLLKTQACQAQLLWL